MADISPSSRKVDDFLSQLSQLSQDHIQQDHQRQRDLQRSIDLLTPPPKPTRPKPAGLRPAESRPALPKRRDELPPPPLPRRREGTPPPMPARKSLYKPLTVPEKKYRSFTDVEREIQSGETPAKPLVPEKKKPPAKPPVKPPAKPPVKPPAKPETLVRDASPKPKEIEAPIPEKLPPKIVPKPSSIKAPATPTKPSLKAPTTPTKPTVKVPKPSYVEYKQKDNELLLSQLAKIKTTKPAPKPKPKKFDLETVQLKSHMTNLSPTRREAARPSIAKYREEDTKLLSQQISRLGKKEPKQPPAPKVSTQDKEDLKEATDFKAHLSSLIRAGTAPTLRSTAASPALERRNTLPTVKREDTHHSGKIAHPTKARTKGPKRRLPQQLKLTSEKPPQQPLKPKPQTQPQKTPPPINKLTKPKAPNPKSSFLFNGDVFI